MSLVYTTNKGERRIRVITQTFPTSSNLTDIIEGTDMCTLGAFIAKKASEISISSGLDTSRNFIKSTCFDIIKTIKSLYLTLDHNNQLKLPENLKLLPIFTLALLNNIAFRDVKKIPIDVRSTALNLIYFQSLPTLINKIIPRFYDIHCLNPMVGKPIEDIKDSVTFPPALNLCSDRIEGSGMYLLDNSQELYIWISKRCSSDLLFSLFHNKYDCISNGKVHLPEPEDEYSRTIHKLINKIKDHHLITNNCYPILYVVKEDGDKEMKKQFFYNLIEDRHEYAPSYPQYLNDLLNQINEKN